MIKNFTSNQLTFGYKGFFVSFKGKYAIVCSLLAICGVGYMIYNVFSIKTQ